MKDVTLVPLVFIIMSVFCVCVFFKRDRLYSRSMLGFCGVVGVLLSLFTGYGIMFLCGVPLTAMTQVRFDVHTVPKCSCPLCTPTDRTSFAVAALAFYCLWNWTGRCFHLDMFLRSHGSVQDASGTDSRHCGRCGFVGHDDLLHVNDGFWPWMSFYDSCHLLALSLRLPYCSDCLLVSTVILCRMHRLGRKTH